jgi:site-specific recombinase
LVAFLALWRATVRLQVAGLLGNLLAVAPCAFVLDACYVQLLHRHVLDSHAAGHVLHANSLLGPSALYAALTGVFLWISSLTGAVAANWARAVRLENRLATNVRVMRHMSPVRARAAARQFVTRWGGLAGNVALGFLLGAVPALFSLLRWPIDIRHVTVSSASLTLAVASQGIQSGFGLAFSGVMVIGLVNVLSSFALALWLATRFARGRTAAGTGYPIMLAGVRRWLGRSRRSRKHGAASNAGSPLHAH